VDFYLEGHQCYIMPKEEEEPMLAEERTKENVKQNVFFFDFECSQDDLVRCDKDNKPDFYGKCAHCLKSSCGSYER